MTGATGEVEGVAEEDGQEIEEEMIPGSDKEGRRCGVITGI